MMVKNINNKSSTIDVTLNAKKHKHTINGNIIIDNTLSNNKEKNNPTLIISFTINILPNNKNAKYFKI